MILEGPEFEPGDSGGGVFALDDGSWELVGMVRGSSSEERIVTDAAPLVDKLRQWHIPVALTPWDYVAVAKEDYRLAEIAFDNDVGQKLEGVGAPPSESPEQLEEMARRLVVMITLSGRTADAVAQKGQASSSERIPRVFT